MDGIFHLERRPIRRARQYRSLCYFSFLVARRISETDTAGRGRHGKRCVPDTGRLSTRSHDMKKAQAGFTLIELMIVVAIIGILAAIALPAYSKYMDKAKYAEVITATTAAKTAVELCVQDKGDVVGCSGGAEGIPANVTNSGDKYLNSVTTTDGVITAVPDAFGSVTAADTYTLTPSFDATTGKVSWTIGGGCLAKQLCKQ
jgi:prepilin-type N-terminal cleavage/methylation domain-containing protein